MSGHFTLTDPATVRTVLFGLAAVLLVLAFVVRKVREKRRPEPRVIRLTLASDLPPMRPTEPKTDTPPPQISPQLKPVEAAGPPESARVEVSEPATAIMPPPEAARPLPVEHPEEIARPPEEIHPEPPPAAESPVPFSAAETYPAPEVSQSPQTTSTPPPAAAEEAVAPAMQSVPYTFLALQERSPVILDILRGALMMVAIVVALALVLLVLPQGGVDRIALALQPRNAPGPPPEKIAFLYLGDEVKDNQFHIRGVVRNITDKPIEQLDATIRIYAPDRTLLETAVVRMDSDIIFPDATASFHLSYPDYHGQFGSYSLDFKLRQGDPVLYKDMRDAARANS
jgi:hypothetical protein